MGGRSLDHLSDDDDEAAEKGTHSLAVFKGRNFCRYFLASFILFASRVFADPTRALSFSFSTNSVSETESSMRENSWTSKTTRNGRAPRINDNKDCRLNPS